MRGKGEFVKQGRSMMRLWERLAKRRFQGTGKYLSKVGRISAKNIFDRTCENIEIT